MTEITITHRIEAPDLTAALNSLADAMKARPVAVSTAQDASQPARMTNNTPDPKAPVKAAETPVVPPIKENPTPAPAAPIVAAPTPAPAPAEAPAKVFTFDDITAAGSQLLEMGKMAQLMELLKSYGVQAVTQLKPEQYADIAAGLRGLGANI